MPFDVVRTLGARHGESLALHDRFMNRQLARALRTVGFSTAITRSALLSLRRHWAAVPGLPVQVPGRA